MSWQVTRQVPDQIRTDVTGASVTGTVVYFTTGAQQSASVFIEDAHYTDPQVVKDAIDARATIVDQVAQLHSDTP